MNILNKLTIKHLKMNKKRTIVSIIGVILSTALMVGIGLLFSTVRDNSMKSIMEANGSQHVIISLDYDKLDIIKNNNKVDSYDYIALLGYSYYGNLNEKINPYIEVVTANSAYYEKIKLIEGRLPQTDQEIVLPKHLINEGIDVKIGDTITLEVGNRYFEEEMLDFENGYQEGEILKNTKTHTYLVVGIIERNVTESYSDPAYIAFTKSDVSNNNRTKALINYKNPKDTYKVSSKIATTLGYTNLCTRIDNECYDEVSYNDALLSMHGTSQYGNVMESMSQVIIIILFLVSIACIIVIYNSFAISVMERKKQFGLFASIGATRHQLSKTVFFEAILIALIGIPLGILSGLLGIGVVITIINRLLPDIFSFPLALSVYPLFMIIPVVFMIITILVSAFIPAKMASRVSPIVAIRQNDDIKIKNKKLKTPKFIRKLFGVEGEIALKNMKRNKKKYRVTIISLFISIVLFISFSAFTKYGIDSAYNFTELPEYDIYMNTYNANHNSEKYLEIIKPILNNEDVKYSITLKRYQSYIKRLDQSFYNKDFIKDSDPTDIHGGSIEFENGYQDALILVLEDDRYHEYIKSLGLNENRVIVVNTGSYVSYENGNRQYITFTPYSKKEVDLQLYQVNTFYDESSSESYVEAKEVGPVMQKLYYTDKLPKYVEASSNEMSITLILSQEMASNYEFYDYSEMQTFIEAPSYKHVWPLIEKTLEDNEDNDHIRIYAYNVKEEMKLLTNMILVIKILLYGFISLVTLIGVTSVFNTINTSINLRRKEFSMLRSMGLTPRGFNKILYFESLFFGLKSLLYGIPVSILVTLLLHNAFDTMVQFKNILIPWESILWATIGVFIIVLISMMYASSKVKKENILDAIREENI